MLATALAQAPRDRIAVPVNFTQDCMAARLLLHEAIDPLEMIKPHRQRLRFDGVIV